MLSPKDEMLKDIKVIISLGNPGDKYKSTRHNSGRIFMHGIDVSKYNNIKFIDSDTYMNESGKYVLDYMKYNNCEIHQIAICYDDITINPGEYKISFGRGDGGHNGVKSVIESLGSKDFWRIRIGIGPKAHRLMELNDHVLGKLTDEDIEAINKIAKEF